MCMGPGHFDNEKFHLLKLNDYKLKRRKLFNFNNLPTDVSVFSLF